MAQIERSEADAVIELLRAEGRDSRGLYYLWERQQWEATQVDLAADASAWPELDPVLRRAVTDVTAWSLRRAHLATGVLVAFVDQAPTEEQQVFLTTQLVDEARQLVFLDRYGTEVIGRDGSDMEERLDETGPALEGAGVLGRIVDLGGELRAGSQTGLTDALGAYHLGTVGAAGLTMATWVVDALEADGELPGWRAGMTLSMQDAFRHVAFALRVAAGDVSGPAGLRRGLDVVRPGIEQLLQELSLTAPLPGAEDLIERSRRSLTRWFGAVAGEGER